MKAKVLSLNEAVEPRPPAARFLCVSHESARAAWLTRALGAAGIVELAGFDPAALVRHIAQCAPALVFVDFGSVTAAYACTAGGAAASVAATQHAEVGAIDAVRVAFPGLAIVALGSLARSDCALAALRAGARDFIDIDGDAAEALRVTRRLLGEKVAPLGRHGKVTVLLGARIGVGVSTLAANLSVQLQKRDAANAKSTTKQHAALIDLGLPVADSSLLLDIKSEFHFVDAVRNLSRIDQTFAHTAFSRHSSGLSVAALPDNLAELREVSHASAVTLLNRLRAFFDHQIVDLGGFSDLEFIAQIVHAADEAWLVCDPNVASAVSAIELLNALRLPREHRPGDEVSGKHVDGADAAKLQLVVDKFDSMLHFSAEQIAARLDLPLLAVLPERAQALGRSVNQGRLLAEIAPRDPYVRALEPLLARLRGVEHGPAQDGESPDAKDISSGLKHLLPSFLKRS